MSEEASMPAKAMPGATSWPADFRRWYIEGARAAVFMSPHWQLLRTTPAFVAALVFIGVLIDMLIDRLYVGGSAEFHWRAVTGGWLYTVVLAWACYLVRRGSPEDSGTGAAPGAMQLFSLLMAQAQVLSLAFGVITVALLRAGWYSVDVLGPIGLWAAWLVPMVWLVASQLRVLGKASRGRLVSAISVVAVLLATAAWYAAPPEPFWYATETGSDEPEPKRLRLTQELMEQQPQLLAQRLQDLQPQRPGVIDMYAIGFAPYANEDVFRRESGMVTDVMAKRFDAAGRTLQLVNHVDTLEQWPWATPLNLRRSIQHFASVMDRDEDVLFLHLTSHGARDGQLSAWFWPMSVATVTPADLKAWLDEAGIRHRVISISACYSGSWIAPLANEDTLVMTAADAEHTSYGCGRGSELTYFGRAMYDEQLRSSTLSFEEAHAAARTLIKEREEEAGKDDGYSNPQISIGAAIRLRLTQLQERLAQDAKP
jgi:hypothetical protein